MVDPPALIAVVGLLLAHNLLIDRLPAWAYVPACLTVAGLLVLVSRPADLGFTISTAALTAGAAGAAAAVGAVTVAAGLRATRPLFSDRRLTERVAYQALARIPLGTVVLEEIAFRGVLLAAVGPVASSGLFGLWHIVPTNLALDLNRVATSPRTRAGALAAAVGATTLAGAGLCWLRLTTESLVAPAIVHAAANSSAVVVASILTRPARAAPRSRAGGPARPRWARRSRRRDHGAAPSRR